jgi:hypothetical protein
MYSFVHVCKNMPEIMRSFPADFDAIIEGSYSQLCDNQNIKEYSLYQINNGIIVDLIAWYKECQLVLLNRQDRLMALEMVEQYLYSRCNPNARRNKRWNYNG